MIIEMMPYQHLTEDKSHLAGIQNRIFASRVGRGMNLQVFLHFTSGREYWDLVDLGFQFKSVQQGDTSYLHGSRPKRKMSLVGIPEIKLSDAQNELQFQQDRLRFPLSHQSEPSKLELPDKVAAMSDWKPVA